MVEEGDKDMGKIRTVEESIRGKERENVRVAKEDRKNVTVEGDGRGGGGVERVRMGWGRGAVPRRPSFPIAFFIIMEVLSRLLDGVTPAGQMSGFSIGTTANTPLTVYHLLYTLTFFDVVPS